MKHRICLIVSALTFILMLTAAAGAAELSLHNYFADHMVLQRDEPVTVLGWAQAGSVVEVTMDDQKQTSTAGDDGKWSVTLKRLPADGKTRELRVSQGGQTITIKDIAIGDVYLFARQTSTDISLGRTDEGKKAAAKYRPNGKFRAMTIKTAVAKEPADQLNDKTTTAWAAVDSTNALKMTGSAFYLGRDLSAQTSVPVGIVDVNMGSAFAIGWLSDQKLRDLKEIFPDDKDLGWLTKSMPEAAEDRDSGAAQKKLDEYWAQQVSNRHAKPADKPSLGMRPIDMPMYPSGGYNAVIHPLSHVAFKAVLLQLGNDYPFLAYKRLAELGLAQNKVELDRAWDQNYWMLKNGYRVTPATLPYVPDNWRKTFNDTDLPIGLILPPASDLFMYALHNREVREIHRRNAERLAGLGLILPDMDNIDFSGQPADDQLLADRCRRWLLADVLGHKDVVATGPIFDQSEAHLSKATIYFKDGTATGLKASGEALKQFEVAGPDSVFYPATARIDGSTIKLTCDEVGQIQFIRYNWVDKPDLGLVNDAGLPAVPFNSDANWEFAWIPPQEKIELPSEYELTADKWEEGNVAIINGSLDNLEGGDSQHDPQRPGPLGFTCGPFGPNLAVVAIEAGTPAEGKLKPGDLIYGANGKSFGDDTYRELANAITDSETEEAGGKLVLGVRRDGKNIDVELQLDVMGSYSPTTPYYCPKTDKIIAKAEQWSASRYRPTQGPASSPTGMLDTDLWFLMATGDPEVQGLVRRAIYNKIRSMDLEPADPHKGGHNWMLGYTGILLGEYYHATGDPNVLPYLKNTADRAAVTQIKEPGYFDGPVPWEVDHTGQQAGGWRQHYNPEGAERWKSGYGLMPHAGMACTMGMQYAKEAGLDIDEGALQRALKHFNYKRAEFGYVLYWYGGDILWKDKPDPISPAAEAAGKLWSMNGKLGTAAALYQLMDGYPNTVANCSRYCVYAYNNTRHGHGGMFFNNLWTPIGAFHGGEAAFKHFMKGQTWWRELFRRADGSFEQAGRGGIGVSYGIPYVAPRKRLRMLGAPASLYADPPEYLKPAIAAHRARDYTLARRLIEKELNERIIPLEQRPAVDHLLESVRILQQSIDHDLAYVEKLIASGDYDYALLEMPQLTGVVAENNPRLQAIIKALESPEVNTKLRELSQLRAKQLNASKTKLRQNTPAAKVERSWVCLTPFEDSSKVKPADPKVGLTVWKMKVVEGRDQAPREWTEQKFNDSGWDDAMLPINWTTYHSALFRGKFDITDKKQIEALRLRCNFFQQANVIVYINGKLVAKIDNIGRGTGDMDALLTDYAIELLNNGENTIAVTSRHLRRWGVLRGQYPGSVKVDFALDAAIKK